MAQRGERLRLVVVLSRHGVRSPTWTDDRLNAYSVQPWPQWSVPPGDLTDHGFHLLELFGAYDRTELARKGLFPAHGCADARYAYVWADTDERTLESGRALAQGLFPGCAPEVHSLAAGVSDPLFHVPATSVAPPQVEAAALAQTQQRLRALIGSDSGWASGAPTGALLRELQRVLLGCAPQEAVCSPQLRPKSALLGAPISVTAGKGERPVEVQGPLAQASTLSEDLLLEYADAMPGTQVGWGKVDEPELRRLLELHSVYFDLVHRTSALARLEASPMLKRILRTLQQGVDGQPVEGALGPADARLVLIAGHDTNLAGVASLLGVHWQLDGRSDDTPPGTELRFELWQQRDGGYRVQVGVAMQTLPQMRAATPLTPSAPPAAETLKLACGTATAGCAWVDFRTLTERAMQP